MEPVAQINSLVNRSKSYNFNGLDSLWLKNNYENKLPWTNLLHVNHKCMLPYKISLLFPFKLQHKKSSNEAKNTQVSWIP